MPWEMKASNVNLNLKDLKECISKCKCVFVITYASATDAQIHKAIALLHIKGRLFSVWDGNVLDYSVSPIKLIRNALDVFLYVNVEWNRSICKPGLCRTSTSQTDGNNFSSRNKGNSIIWRPGGQEPINFSPPVTIFLCIIQCLFILWKYCINTDFNINIAMTVKITANQIFLEPFLALWTEKMNHSLTY